MTASEFAYLAIGFVLGLATGAAIILVFRSRPSARPEVRLTVAPNSIRRRATTLADEGFTTSPSEPARGGPADRRGTDRPPAAALQAADPSAASVTQRPAITLGPPALPRPSALAVGANGGSVTGLAPASGEGSVPVVRHERAGSSAAAGRPAFVGIPIVTEADPMLQALRATAPAVVAAGGAGSGPIAGSTFEPFPIRPGSSLDRERAVNAGPTPATGSVGSSGLTGGAASSSGPAGPSSSATSGSSAGGGGAISGGSGSTAEPAGTPAAAGDSPATGADDPCGELRRTADERCAVAGRARQGADAAADALKLAQRTHDDHVSRAEMEAATADPRAVRTSKETAQQAFRQARATARSRPDVEAAARDWLTEINRINQATREATQRAERGRAAAVELVPAIERLAVEADAARLAADAADRSCQASRAALAACEASLAAASRPAAGGLDRQAAPAAASRPRADTDPAGPEQMPRLPAVHPPPPVTSPWTAFAAPDGTDDEIAGDDAAVVRMLRGDRAVMQRIVTQLAGEDPASRRRWLAALTELIEAMIARSIEASALYFPPGHPFWETFTRLQSRDIMTALASLGYRYDGLGGWADDRVPAQRDLALAVGYAGLDPMRIRSWPAEPEMRQLLSDITVAADEYVQDAAGTLTLGELVTLLGRRADGLTDLWNEWPKIRPLLMSSS